MLWGTALWLCTAHTLTQRHCEGNSSQIINSRLNTALYTSKAQDNWMDLCYGTLRYTPRYRAHTDTQSPYLSLSLAEACAA